MLVIQKKLNSFYAFLGYKFIAINQFDLLSVFIVWDHHKVLSTPESSRFNSFNKDVTVAQQIILRNFLKQMLDKREKQRQTCANPVKLEWIVLRKS